MISDSTAYRSVPIVVFASQKIPLTPAVLLRSLSRRDWRATYRRRRNSDLYNCAGELEAELGQDWPLARIVHEPLEGVPYGDRRRFTRSHDLEWIIDAGENNRALATNSDIDKTDHERLGDPTETQSTNGMK